MAQRLGIDEGAANRLIDLLATAHGNETDYLPLYVESNGDTSSIHTLQKSGSLGPVSLTQRELAALQAALDALGVSQSDPLRKKLTDRCVDSSHTVETTNLSKVLATAYASPSSSTLFEVSRALGESLDLSFLYQGTNDDQPRHRTVSPAGLYHRGRDWYLDAYDHNRRGNRTFRIDRMSKVHSIPRSEPSGPMQDDQGSTRLVKLRFADAEIFESREWPGIHVLHRDDSCIIASLPYYESSSSWLVRRLASCGGRVTTDDPALRAQVGAYARQLMNHSQEDR